MQQSVKLSLRFIATFVIPATVLAGDPAVVQELRRDLLGKEFSIRVPIAGSTCIHDAGMSIATSRLVDTEVDEHDRTRYYVRADRFLNIRECSNPVGQMQKTKFTGTFIPPEQVTNMHSIGELMTIKGIQAKPDRIEFELTLRGSTGDESYAKLKLFVGQGYERKSLEQLERSLARVLNIPRMVQLDEALAKFDSLRSEITSLEHDLPGESSAAKRFEKADRLIALYQQESVVATLLNSVAFEKLPMPQNSTAIETARRMMGEAKRQIERERLNTAIDQFTASVALMRSSCGRLSDTPVTNRGELNSQRTAVDSARRDLKLFENARKEMVNLGQTVPQEEEDRWTKCIASCDALSQTFAMKSEGVQRSETAAAEAEKRREAQVAERKQQRERAQQLARLDDEYQKMKKQQAALDAKLITLLGGANEAEIFASYRDLLAKMIQNREQAVTLGSHAAEKQLQILNDQFRKLETVR